LSSGDHQEIRRTLRQGIRGSPVWKGFRPARACQQTAMDLGESSASVGNRRHFATALSQNAEGELSATSSTQRAKRSRRAVSQQSQSSGHTPTIRRWSCSACWNQAAKQAANILNSAVTGARGIAEETPGLARLPSPRFPLPSARRAGTADEPVTPYRIPCLRRATEC